MKIKNKSFIILLLTTILIITILSYPSKKPLNEEFRRWGWYGGRWSYPWWRRYYKSGYPYESYHGIKGFGGGYLKPWWRSYWPWGSMNSGYFYY